MTKPTHTPRFFLLALLAYVALVVATTAYHEPWRDEADAWLAARDLSVPQLFHFTGYVGTPCLWYLTLMVPAKLGLPYATMGWLNAMFAVASAAVFLSRAPMPRITRVVVIFSYYLAYEYAAIARIYALTALFLFLAAATYPRRRSRPIRHAVCIVLLSLASAHGTLLAGILLAAAMIELLIESPARKRARLAGLAIMLAGWLFAVWQLWPAADSQRPQWLINRQPSALIDALTRAIAIPIGSPVLDPLPLALNLIFIAALAIYLLRRPKVLLLMFAGLAALAYIFVFKWCVPTRHAGLILLWLLFILWIARSVPAAGVDRVPLLLRVRRQHVIALLTIALVPACYWTAVASVDEVRIEYSHGRQMADFMLAHNLDGRPVAASMHCESVLPYLHKTKQFWNINTSRWLSHNRWDVAFEANWDFAQGWMAWEQFQQNWPSPMPRPLLMWHWPLPAPQSRGYELIYQTHGPTGPFGEQFFLYAPIKD